MAEKELKTIVKHWLKENHSSFLGYSEKYTIEACINESKEYVGIYTDCKDFYEKVTKSTKFKTLKTQVSKGYEYDLKVFYVLSYGLETEELFYEISQSNIKVKSPEQIRKEKEKKEKADKNRKLRELAKKHGFKKGDVVEYISQEYNEYEEPEEMVHHTGTITGFYHSRYSGEDCLTVTFKNHNGYENTMLANSLRLYDENNYELRHECYMENNDYRLRVGAKIWVQERDDIFMVQRIISEWQQCDVIYIQTATGMEEVKGHYLVTHAN